MRSTPARRTKRPSFPEETALTPTIQSIRLSSGIELPYAEQGDPAGVPVVFVHGVTDAWRSFEGVLPHLPASSHAFALTQRGHGGLVNAL